MTDLSRTAPATHVLAVGVYNAPKEEVQPGFLTLLDPAPAKIEPPPPAWNPPAAAPRWPSGSPIPRIR